MVEGSKSMAGQDYMNIKFEHSIVSALSKEGKSSSKCINCVEVILFSAEIVKDKVLFFKKRRVILVTNTHVCIIDKNKRYFKKRDDIGKDLLSITQSLLIGNHNFIMHFRTRPD